jgi:hypothetical protein
VIARRPNEGAYNLYRLFEDGSPPVRLGDAAFGSLAFLHVSRDGRLAAAVDVELRTLLIALQDGATRPLTAGGAEHLVPQGWSPEGHLWVTEGGPTSRARTRLLRVDPQSGRVLEERSIGPADSGGVFNYQNVVLSPDGREVAFAYSRTLGRLYIVSGLGR